MRASGPILLVLLHTDLLFRLVRSGCEQEVNYHSLRDQDWPSDDHGSPISKIYGVPDDR